MGQDEKEGESHTPTDHSGAQARESSAERIGPGSRSPPIVVERWEMDAMRKVPLVPAHLRGHFLRNYAVLTGQRAPIGSAWAVAAGERQVRAGLPK